MEQGVLVRDSVGARHTVPLPTGLHIPTTVQGVLAARIDRLSPGEKALLQQLAVIGRQFPLSLVRQVLSQPEAELYYLLASLQRKEFLYEQPAFPESEYLFKHALTQEVAYGTVLQERRKTLHEQTGQAIEQLFHDCLNEYYSALAHHYGRSGNTQKAVEYLQLAGQQAAQRSAHTEAISHLTTALELLKTLPDTPGRGRTRQELTLHLSLGAVVVCHEGVWRHRSGTDLHSRAGAVSAGGGAAPDRAVLFGLWAFYVVRGNSQAALALGEQHLKVAQRHRIPPCLLVAHALVGATLLLLGELARAQAH